jgi:hypothetical protein
VGKSRYLKRLCCICPTMGLGIRDPNIHRPIAARLRMDGIRDSVGGRARIYPEFRVIGLFILLPDSSGRSNIAVCCPVCPAMRKFLPNHQPVPGPDLSVRCSSTSLSRLFAFMSWRT